MRALIAGGLLERRQLKSESEVQEKHRGTEEYRSEECCSLSTSVV